MVDVELGSYRCAWIDVSTLAFWITVAVALLGGLVIFILELAFFAGFFSSFLWLKALVADFIHVAFSVWMVDVLGRLDRDRSSRCFARLLWSGLDSLTILVVELAGSCVDCLVLFASNS